MKTLIYWGGYGCATVGVLTCVLSGLLRLTGTYRLGGLDTGTLFQLGIGLMVVACLAMLQRLLQQRS